MCHACVEKLAVAVVCFNVICRDYFVKDPKHSTRIGAGNDKRSKSEALRKQYNYFTKILMTFKRALKRLF